MLNVVNPISSAKLVLSLAENDMTGVKQFLEENVDTIQNYLHILVLKSKQLNANSAQVEKLIYDVMVNKGRSISDAILVSKQYKIDTTDETNVTLLKAELDSLINSLPLQVTKEFISRRITIAFGENDNGTIMRLAKLCKENNI